MKKNGARCGVSTFAAAALAAEALQAGCLGVNTGCTDVGSGGIVVAVVDADTGAHICDAKVIAVTVDGPDSPAGNTVPLDPTGSASSCTYGEYALLSPKFNVEVTHMGYAPASVQGTEELTGCDWTPSFSFSDGGIPTIRLHKT